MTHYVYELIDPRSNHPFYVGQGKYERVSKTARHDDHLVEAAKFASGKRWKSMNRHKLAIISEIVAAGLTPVVNIVFEGTQRDVNLKEIEVIAKYGRMDQGGLLANMTDGGTGGVTRSDSETSRKKSEAMKRRLAMMSDEQKQEWAKKRGEGRRKAWARLTDEEKQARMAPLSDPAVKIKASESNKARDYSCRQQDTYKKKISDKLKEHWATMDTEARSKAVDSLLRAQAKAVDTIKRKGKRDA